MTTPAPRAGDAVAVHFSDARRLGRPAVTITPP